MKKRIIDCTYKEVRSYYEHHRWDTDVSMILGAFGKAFALNEVSWDMRRRYEFPRVFSKVVLEKEIDLSEENV